MAVVNRLAGMASIEDAIAALMKRKGAHNFVVCTSTRKLAHAVIQNVVRHASARSNLLLVHTGRRSASMAASESLPITTFSSQNQLLRQLRLALRAGTNKRTLLVEYIQPFLKSAISQRRIIDDLNRTARTLSLLVIWVVYRRALSSEALNLLKRHATAFLSVEQSGDLTLAHFVSVNDSNEADALPPSVLTITENSLRFTPLHVTTRRAARDRSDDPLDEQYRRTFELSAEPMLIFSLKENFLRLNRRAKEILGYNDKLPNVRDLIPATMQFALRRALVTLRKKGKHAFAIQVKRKDEKVMDIHVRVASIGKNLFSAVCTDISRQIELQAERDRVEQQYRTLLADLPHPYAIFLNRKLVASNTLFASLFPWTANTSPSLSKFFGRRNSDLVHQLGELVQKAQTDARIENREIRISSPDRKSVTVEVTATVIPYFGKSALYCTFVDVSARRAVLEHTARIEQKFQTLLNGSLDAISVTKDGTILLANEAFAKMFGYASPMELLGKKLSTTIWGRNAYKEILDSHQQITGESRESFDYVGRMKDGTKIVVQGQSSRICFDGKDAILTYHRDITARRHEEEEFQRKVKGFELLNRFIEEIAAGNSVSEIYHRGMLAAMRGMAFESAAALVVAGEMLVLKHHHGLSEVIRTKLETHHLDEGFARFFDKTHDVVFTSVLDYPPHLPYKVLFASEGVAAVALVPVVVEEKLHGLLVLVGRKLRVPDEYDRLLLASLGKQLGAAVQRRLLVNRAAALDRRFHATVASLAEVLYTLSPNGSFTYLSPNIEHLTGYKPGDFAQNPNLWRTLLHPDDRPTLSQRISHQALGKNEMVLEYRLLPKGKATYIWLRDLVKYERDEEKRVVAIHGIVSEITAAKHLAQLRTSAGDDAILARQQFDILESFPEGIAVLDRNLECVEWNAALEQLTGVSSNDALGKHVHDLPILREAFQKIAEGRLAEDSTAQENIELWTGETSRALTVRLVPRVSADGVRTGTLVWVRDSTSLWKVQRDMRRHEELLRNLLDAGSEAVLIASTDGRILDVNRAFEVLTGYGREEVRATGLPYPWIADEDAMRMLERMGSLVATGEPQQLEMIWQHKSGQHTHVRVYARSIQLADGDPTAILLLAQDITEQRRLADELDWKTKQIALLNRILSFANATADLPSIFKTIADEIRSLIRYEGISVAFIDEEQNLTPWYAAVASPSGESEYVHYLPLDVPTIYDAVRTGLPATATLDADGQARAQISIPLSVDDRAIGAMTLVRYEAESFRDDERAFLQPVAEHIGAIIQRTKLFDQVRNDSAYIRNLLNSINQIIFTVDRNYRITHVNKAWKEFMRRQGKQIWAEGERILGQSLEVVMPDAATWEQYKRVMDDVFSRRIEYYARDVEVFEGEEQATYHLVINPMVINERVTGLVFTQTDITELNRTEAEIKRRNRELVALNTIATSISKSLDLDEILRVATDQVRDSFGASVVGFYLRTEEDSLILTQSVGLSEKLAAAIRRIDVAASLGLLFGPHRMPVYVLPGGDTDGPLVEVARHVSTTMDLASCAIVSLQSKEKLPGAFIIGFRALRAFTEREQQLLILIGRQIGAAIENAQLYGEIQHQVQTLTTLYELGRDLTGLLDLNSMLQVVYRAVTRALPLERFYYQAYSPEHNTLTLLSRTVDGIPQFYPEGVKVRALTDWPNTIYQNVVSQGKPYLGRTSRSANDSILAVPIKSADRVVGIISIVSPIAGLYTGAHLRLLESIANLTGVAIGKAMLYEDTLKKTAEIENRNKELDDFTYVVSHDLKEPLISIEGYSQIVMKDYHDRLDDEGREYLTAVVHSATRMKHLIDDLLTLSRLGRMNEVREAVSVRAIVDEILHDFQFSLRERRVVVNVQKDLPIVRFSNTRLSMVFRNLISNAMKFNDKPMPLIDIGCNELEDEYCFWVKDNGIGIEHQYFDRIFAIFQRLKRSEEYRGTGAGLTIVKKIVEREGGRIWLESVPGEGSTFYFTIKKKS